MSYVRRLPAFIVLASAVALAAVSSVSAGDKRPMGAIDLLEVPALAEAQLSPDGKQLLYVLGEADWKANKRIEHIWRVGVDGSGSVQLTNGADGEDSPRWSPDGQSIAFVAKRGDDEHDQIYLLANRGGEARRLSKHETSVGSISWSRDGSSFSSSVLGSDARR